jgi:alpha-ribazole phosphatase/probable phosphoglycerate mutase
MLKFITEGAKPMIYLTRHGQTEWNALGKVQGKTDISLNEMGREQAQIVKDKLKNIKFDLVFSSPLSRALETAKIITGRNETINNDEILINKFDKVATSNKIIIDSRIIERDCGEFEGKPFDGETINWNDENETRFGIETLKDLYKRITSFFDEIRNNYKNKNILVVSHAGFLIHSQVYLKGKPQSKTYEEYRIKNCQVVEISN